LALAHHLLRGTGIVPEIRSLGAAGQFIQLFLRNFRVKDTSAKGRGFP